MRDYVHLHRKAIASWVFQDSRRWHLFSYLLMRADEEGRVEVSVNEYANTYGIDRSWLRRTLAEMVERNIIDQQTTNKKTIITICKYGDYNHTATIMCNKSDQQTTNKQGFVEEKESERESNVPPAPLSYKEKEKEREEFSATALRRKQENDGQTTLFQELREENESSTVNQGEATPKAPSFEQFWEAYAYKRDRRSAERAWNRMSLADRRAAFEGIQRYKDDCAAYNRQMMYAQGYLNRRRWEDDLTTTPHPTACGQTPHNNYQPHNNYATESWTDRKKTEARQRAMGAAALVEQLLATNRDPQ